MAGPLLIMILFGFLLLLGGKIQFGNIYGCGLSGCFGICVLINLLTKKEVYVSFYSTISILGYSLLPFVFLAAASLGVGLNENIVGTIICMCTVTWSTITATRLFSHSLDMEDQMYLIAYPIMLFYAIFVLLTVY
jgi:protein YIPF5/7